MITGTSPLIYGSHEPCPRDVLTSGWVLFLVEVGDNPEPHPGIDLSDWSDAGYGTIVRIQYRWGDQAGTLPRAGQLERYVARVRSLVANSRGCARWIIGNEPSNRVEWPGGWRLLPDYVAFCYNRCWSAIHDLPGHEKDEVLLPPIGPWNIDTGLGWLDYFQQMIREAEFIDGFAIHAYTHGSDPALITSETKMDPPYHDCHYNFRVYRDWLDAIPPAYRTLPVYLTETNQNGPWLDQRNGWVQEMYLEIDTWNRNGNQPIRCVLLYRWPKYDAYHIEGKINVIADFIHAQSFGYSWPLEPDPPDPPDPCVPCEDLEVIAAKLTEVEMEIDRINARLRAAGIALIGEEA